MRFNTHCHVFNLQSVFNQDTIFILKNRLMQDHGLSPGGAELAVSFIKLVIAHHSGSDTQGLPNGWRHGDPWSALELGTLSNMDMVAKDMVQQLDNEGGDPFIFVPLMMDILCQPEPEPAPARPDLFDIQVQGTQRQMMNYPGRMLPFYAVNSNRRDFVDRTIQALRQDGFVGVKLYPSLGYSLRDLGMDTVIRYCNDNEIPILMHCNQGGFKKDDNTVTNCSPEPWGLVEDGDGFLDTYPKLKICFAHFGGSENFVQENPGGSLLDVSQTGSWSAFILSLMKAEGYRDRVFADVSFHEESLPGPLAQRYLTNLKAIMSRDECRRQVLWGSDTWLLRMVSTEIDYWHGFTGQYILPIEHFHLMWDANPRKFLGFGNGDPAQYTPNIWAYVRYMEANKARFASGMDVHPWLTAAMAIPEGRRKYPADPAY